MKLRPLGLLLLGGQKAKSYILRIFELRPKIRNGELIRKNLRVKALSLAAANEITKTLQNIGFNQ